MKSFKVVITDYNFPNVEVETSLLEAGGCQVIACQCRNEQELLAVAADADGVIDQFFPLTESIINRLTRCRVIAVYGVGTDQIDLEAASKRGIRVVNVPEYCTEEVAIHTISLVLACARGIMRYAESVKAGQWRFDVVKLFRLSRQTVGIVGFGRIGKRVAEYLAPLGVFRVAYDPQVSSEEMAQRGVKKVSLEELVEQSDFVTLHVPLTSDTKHLVSESLLRRMKPTAYLINVARGGLVDEGALYRALREGWIAGAALDVLSMEPPGGTPLLGLDNVLVTPHVAWYSEQAYDELRRGVVEGVLNVLRGRDVPTIVNRELLRLYGWL